MTERVDIYDVLMDEEHPLFGDLGRLLWSLVTTQWGWVDRRVETVALVGERRFRRRMSVDCRPPVAVIELAEDLGFERFILPLRFVTKEPLLAFDLRFDEHTVPLLTRSQNTMAARAVLHAAVDQLGVELTHELVQALGEVADSDVPGETRAIQLLNMTGPGRLGELATPADLVRWALTTFDRHYLLLADVPLASLDHRRIFHISQDLAPNVSGRLPLRSAIAWEPSSFVFDIPEVAHATSFHFQFVAPEGLMTAGGELFIAEEDDEGARTTFGRTAGRGPVIGLNAHLEDCPEADNYNAEVLLRPSPDGLLRAGAVSSLFTTALLLLATAVAGYVEDAELELAAALLLVLPGVLSTYLARPGEHFWVSRIVRSIRGLIFTSAAVVYLAAGVLVVGVSQQTLRGMWLALALVSAIPAILLSVAVRRSRLPGWS